MSFIFSALILIFSNNLEISGTVLDYDEPLVGVTIMLQEVEKGTITTQNGKFVINDVAPGTYTINISHIGYITQQKTVVVHEKNINIGIINLREDYFQLQQVIVSATRNEIMRNDAPIMSNIVNDKLFDATQSVVLSEGLNFQPALRVENNCQNCGFNSLRMNGLEGAYSQILVDGRPIFNSLQGVYGLEQIPTNMIERVEIVRSGGSALYGSSAVAGTVNIITKEPTENSTYIKTNLASIAGTSSDQTFMIGTDVVNDNQVTGLTLSGFHRNRSFWDDNNDGFSDIGQIRANSFALKAFYKPSDLSKITLNGFNIYEFRRGGNKFELPFHETDITESTTHNILNGGITYEQYSKNKNHKISTYLNYQNLLRDSYYGSQKDVNAYGKSEDNSVVGGFQYTGYFDNLSGVHTLVTGLEYNKNNMRDNAPSYNRFINQIAEQFGFYIQDLWEIGKKINVLLGGRVDKHNLVEEIITSPRMNILYKISTNVQIRGGYARGFRAPQVFDEDLHITQVSGEGTVVRNIKNLSPEYSNAFSWSFDYNKFTDDWSLGLTLDAFYTKLTDVFVLEEKGSLNNGDLLLERKNAGFAVVKGFTINPKLQYKDKLNIQLGFTIQNSEYDKPIQWSESVSNSNKTFFRTPNSYGFYVFSWQINNKLMMNFSGVYTGSMIVQHYAGYIQTDALKKTSYFVENNFKIDFSTKINQILDITFNAGIQNYTNQYQNDLDKGINRDAGYVYGPGRPRTFFVGMNLKL